MTGSKFATSLCIVGLLVVSISSRSSAQTKVDLSVPSFEPKPVVWLENWKPQNADEPAARKEARAKVRLADRLKSQEQYAIAKVAYLRAMKTDPKWAYPVYQLACNYELADQHDKAVPVFRKAIELGYDDFPTAFADDELGELRQADDFKQTLAKIRERYIKVTTERIGVPVAVRPKGDRPDSGWPLIMLLHGYGDSNESYIPYAEAWAELGFVCVAVPGSLPASSGRYTWKMDSFEPTLRDVRAIVKSELLMKEIDKNNVCLLGFSQGALHSLLIAAKYPDEFSGVVALSPGGGNLSQKMMSPELSRGKPGRLVFIHAEEEPHAPIAQLWKRACDHAGWKFMSQTHDGGHHFPSDWKTRRLAIAQFLKR